MGLALRTIAGEERCEMKVIDLMRAQPRSVTKDDALSTAAWQMWEGDCGVVPVIDEDRRVVGMLTDRDACMAAWSRGSAMNDIRVGEVMAKHVYSCWSDDSIEAALELMRERRLRRLPVVDASERLVGILSLSDLALSCARGGARELRPAVVGNLLAAISTPHGESSDGQLVLKPRPAERIEVLHAITSIA